MFRMMRAFGLVFTIIWVVFGAAIVWDAAQSASGELAQTVALVVGGALFMVFWFWALERARRFGEDP
jgi:hypothetical protein